MTRETIENAAKETLVNEPVELQATKVGVFQRGFITGAEWRINSVWHDASEEPERNGEPMLVEFHDFGMDGNSYDVVEDLQGYRTGIYVEFIRWAYVSDLIPERKEETNGGR
ncbi:hypothetical protein [Phocaeicola salanitronis]|uniref:hypothetical protein n=1 Tax=Phocaeicola salanitronis TaxID=376805 RepID=UPI0023F7FBEE|nr:hypothetical protein [Phocaeicola salanitronis]